VALPAGAGAQFRECGVAGGFEQPAGEKGAGAQARGLAGENEEDSLGDLLGEMRVAHLPQGGGMDEIEMPRDERLKRRLGLVPGKFPHQGHVIGCLHSPTYARPERNRTNYF
jgi:hypothetical protein